MASLNVEKILTGTPNKSFLQARKELAENYNETSANEFYYMYCDTPLSFLLEHSREIFSETYFGYEFYVNLIHHSIYDPRVYATEAKKVRDYIALARSKKLPASQIEKYTGVLDELEKSVEKYPNFIRCMEIAASSENAEKFFTHLTNCMYDYDRAETSDDALSLDEITESIFGIENVYCKILGGFIFCMRHRDYTPYLIEATRRIFNRSSVVPKVLGDIERLTFCIKTLLQDNSVVDMIMHLDNGKITSLSLLECWMNVANNENRAMKLSAAASEASNKEIQQATENKMVEMGIDRINEFSSNQDIKDMICCAKYENCDRLHAIYEAKLEATYGLDNLIQENAEDTLFALEAEMQYLEWEDDGSPNAVIQKQIMTSKEKAELEAKKEASKNSMYDSLVKQNVVNSEKVSSESALCDKIKSDIRKIGNIDGIAHLGASNDEINQLLKESRSHLVEYRKKATEKNYQRALGLCDDLENEIQVSDPMMESVDNVVDKKLAMFLEESEEKEKEKPKKPDYDLATKIQNKALDRAAKDEERFAKANEKGQKLKNAANAVSSTPKRISGDLKKFVADFDKWDDNRRKEFLMKPGYRHKIIKKFKDSIMLGSIASINLAWIPMAALIRHCSKLKDKRIRNELAKELENEIRICEEKISDANSAGDNKSKYELMRIKDKLEAEKTRVRINSNFM